MDDLVGVGGDDEGVIDAITRARRQVAQSLQKPDDFSRIEQLRLRALRKRVASEKRLKTVVQSHITDVYEAFQLLEKSLQDLQTVQTELDESERLIEKCDQLQHHVGQAKVVTNSRNKLRSTLKQLEHIISVPDEIAMIEDILAQENPNLLSAHRRLMQVEYHIASIQEKIFNSSSLRKTDEDLVKKYFASVVETSTRFRDLLFYVARDPLGLVHSSPETLVTVLRIVMREEKLDRDRLYSWAPKKNLKEKFFANLKREIDTKFDCLLGEMEQIPKFLDHFDEFYFADLRTAKHHLPQCFPPAVDIFNFYLNEYHNKLCDATERVRSQPTTEPSDIMLLLNWVHDYKAQMKSQLGVHVSRFDRQLLGVEQSQLKEKYVEMLESKLQLWVSNLVRSESKIMLELPGADEERDPPTVTDGVYVTDTPVIFFQMIEQQLDVAFQKGGGGAFAAKVLALILDCIQHFHSEQQKLLEKVREMYLGEDPEQEPPLLLEHLIANLNNNHRSKKYLQEFLAHVQEKYRSTGVHHTDAEYKYVENKIQNQLLQGFATVALEGVKVVIDIVFAVVEPLFSKLFTTTWLRKRSLLGSITATLEDYFEDLALVNGEHKLLVNRIVYKKIAILYLQAMMLKRFRAKDSLDREIFVDGVKTEQKALREFFQKHNIFHDSQHGKDPFGAVTYVCQILEETEKTVPITYYRARTDYPGFNLNHLEALLSIREDFKSSPRSYIKEKFFKKKRKNIPPAGSREDVDEANFFIRIKTETKEFAQYPSEESS